MIEKIPHELAFSDVYVSPMLVVIVFSFMATSIMVIVLNRLKLSKFMVFPSLSFVAIMLLFIVAIDEFLIKI
jgi:hypothetical protein